MILLHNIINIILYYNIYIKFIIIIIIITLLLLLLLLLLLHYYCYYYIIIIVVVIIIIIFFCYLRFFSPEITQVNEHLLRCNLFVCLCLCLPVCLCACLSACLCACPCHSLLSLNDELKYMSFIYINTIVFILYLFLYFLLLLYLYKCNYYFLKLWYLI